MASPDLNTILQQSYDGALKLADEQMRHASDKHPDGMRIYNVTRALAYLQQAVAYADLATTLYDTGSPRYEAWAESLHATMRAAGTLESQIEMALTESDIHRDLCLSNAVRRKYTLEPHVEVTKL